jgi:ATP-dependent protease ClpP protease subunit
MDQTQRMVGASSYRFNRDRGDVPVSVYGAITDGSTRFVAWPEWATVHVTIDSHGGDLRAALRLAKRIEAHHGPTVATVTGRCSSAAVVVLAACQYRRAVAYASFLIHEAAAIPPGQRLTSPAAMELARAADRGNAVLFPYLARRLGLPLEEIIAIGEGEGARFRIEKALDLGLVHVVA